MFNCCYILIVYLFRTFTGQLLGNPLVYILTNQAFSTAFIEWSALEVHGTDRYLVVLVQEVDDKY